MSTRLPGKCSGLPSSLAPASPSRANPANDMVLADHTILDLVILTGLDRDLHRLGDAILIERMNGLDEEFDRCAGGCEPRVDVVELGKLPGP